MQSWSLDRKIKVSHTRILEWYKHWDKNVYVSFSGGKDSTVLAWLASHICKLLGCTLVLWFSDTGLEFPEIRSFVKEYAYCLEKETGVDVDLIVEQPRDKYGDRVNFRDIIDVYGYPLISKHVSQIIYEYKTSEKLHVRNEKYFDPNSEYCRKYGKSYCLEKWIPLRDSGIPVSHKCCEEMKKKPAKNFEKVTGLRPIVGSMACESRSRKNIWLKNGCNAFDSTRPMSLPISFWTEQDILECIARYSLPYASVYGNIVCNEWDIYSTTGQSRTGCMFCGFGVHLQKEPNNFQRMKKTHPKIWEYCMKPRNLGGLGMRDILGYVGIEVD